MQTPKDRGPCSRVELVLSARALADKDVFSKSDPICVVEELVQRGHQPQFVEIGRTECIKNCLNPQWSKKIRVDYHFESKQLLRFNLYDLDSDSAKLSDHDFLGRCECELADIVASPDGTIQLRVKDLPNQSGVLTVCAEEMDEGQRESLHVACRGVGLKQSSLCYGCCTGGVRNAFLEVYRQRDDGSRQMVHRTESARARRHPEWRPFHVSLKHLSGGNKERDFIMECYEERNSGNHQLIGATSTTVVELCDAPKGQRMELELTKPGKKGSTGTIHFMEARLKREYTFLDYITRGMQLEFAVSVDLTASNGEVTKSSSLHYVNPHYMNQYECAIGAVLEICEHYNQSKQFEALGFGAKIPPAFGVSHMFPLRLNNFERNVHGMQGVLDAYRFAIVNTQLYGPTNFAPTIREFVHKTSQFPRDGTRYQVLLILTDGVITDIQNTIRAIIEASHQPMSIIIIGIGNENFDKMDALDADQHALSMDGRTAVRDIVQFVPFRNFIGSSWQNAEEQAYLKTALAKEVLAELPDQVCSFMNAHNIVPPLRTPPPHHHQQQAPSYPQLPQNAPPAAHHSSPPPPYPVMEINVIST